ncbi:MAG: AtpZ/AtpI family protein [Thermodesulfobacteriota bacterium]
MKKDTRDAVRLLATASTMGLAMVLAIFIGYGVGYYLDKYLGTTPYLTYIFLILGIIAGFKNLYTIGKRVLNMSEDKDKK